MSEYVRIKIGSPISQDRGFGKWPACCPPKEEGKGLLETIFPERVFIATLETKGNDSFYWECMADGYGMLQSKHKHLSDQDFIYGNGSIYVTGKDAVEIVSEKEYKESEKKWKNIRKLKKTEQLIPKPTIESLQQENTALKAELAAIKQGEPVTWRQPISDGSNVYSKISAEDAIDSAKQQLIMFPDIDGVERCLVGDVEPLYLAAPVKEGYVSVPENIDNDVWLREKMSDIFGYSFLMTKTKYAQFINTIKLREAAPKETK